jgi:hypothetical protein
VSKGIDTMKSSYCNGSVQNGKFKLQAGNNSWIENVPWSSPKMNSKFSMLNIYHPYGCPLKGQRDHATSCLYFILLFRIVGNVVTTNMSQVMWRKCSGVDWIGWCFMGRVYIHLIGTCMFQLVLFWIKNKIKYESLE